MMKRIAACFAPSLLAVVCTLPLHANPIATGFSTNSLAANDDGSTGLVGLGFTANFFGVSYSSGYVNNNGNVTFSGALSTYTPFGLAASSQSIIAPFFADVDTRGPGSALTTYGTGTYKGEQAFGVTWNGVGYYPASTNKLDYFQVILTNRADTGAGNFDIYFNYGPMQWETGGASGGSNGLGGASAVVGYSNGIIAGANETTFQLPGSAVNGALIDGGIDALSTHTNDGVTGQYLFQARSGSIAPPPTSVTPEPGSFVLLGTGGLALAGTLRRRLLQKM